MLEGHAITESEAQRTAVIHVTIPRSEIQSEMGAGITELMATVQEQGIGPTGPWYTHHFRMDPDTFDFEIGVPVSAPVTPAGRVVAGELPAAKVARVVYSGGFEGLADAWGEFDAWITQQGLAPAEDLWERYLAGPESSDDPSTWRTELNRPLVG